MLSKQPIRSFQSPHWRFCYQNRVVEARFYQEYKHPWNHLMTSKRNIEASSMIQSYSPIVLRHCRTEWAAEQHFHLQYFPLAVRRFWLDATLILRKILEGPREWYWWHSLMAISSYLLYTLSMSSADQIEFLYQTWALLLESGEGHFHEDTQK